MKIRTPPLPVVLFFSCLLLQSGTEAAAQTANPGASHEANAAAPFYVATDGNDSWSGRLPAPDLNKHDGPFATLTRARDAARLAKAADASLRQRIVVGGGRYFLDTPLELTPDDSGLIVEGAAGAKPMLYGGRRITGWQRDGDKFWAAPLPDVGGKPWDFRMLMVNGRVAPRSRLPREGTFSHLSEFKQTWAVGGPHGWLRRPTTAEMTTMVYRPEDLGPWLDLKNAELTIQHMWNASVVGLASNDPATHTLTFSNATDMPRGADGVRKYTLWNQREGMTDAGQWYLDRTARKVVYWPLPGENVAEIEVLAPTMDTVVQIQGGEDAGVQQITLRGLAVSVANTPVTTAASDWTIGGFNAISQPGAVQIRGALDCTLDNLAVSKVVGQGIKASSATGLLIENCNVSETGASGIVVSGGHCTVTNNHVSQVGLIYPNGIGIASLGYRAVISHNDVHDTSYDGIFGNGDGLLIEGNLVHRVMQGLHDGAGIYIEGTGEGMVIRGNFVRDIIDTGGYGAAAYYVDELCKEVLVEDNLSLGVARPINCHIGNRNLIRNNVFINDGDMELQFPRCIDQRLEHNILWAGRTISIHPLNAITEASGNILFSKTGTIKARVTPVVGNVPTAYNLSDAPPLVSDSRWSLIDPQIIEFKEGRVRFSATSPAQKLGIRLVDVSAAGTRKAADAQP